MRSSPGPLVEAAAVGSGRRSAPGEDRLHRIGADEAFVHLGIPDRRGEAADDVGGIGHRAGAGAVSLAVQRFGVEIYGDVSDEVRQFVAPFGAGIAGYWAGFTR